MMKTTKSIMSMVLITAMSAVVIIFSACEKDKDSNSSSLNENALFDSSFGGEFEGETEDQVLHPLPASAGIVSVGEVKTFRVTGGNKPYNWSVSKAGSGTLDKTTTLNSIESVRYTATAVAANTIVVTDARGRAAVIEISAATPNLTVSPTALSYLATDMIVIQNAQFTSTGGTTPITWAVDSPSLCGITAAGAWSSKVVPANNWSNTVIKVIATDNVGATAEAIITFK